MRERMNPPSLLFSMTTDGNHLLHSASKPVNLNNSCSIPAYHKVSFRWHNLWLGTYISHQMWFLFALRHNAHWCWPPLPYLYDLLIPQHTPVTKCCILNCTRQPSIMYTPSFCSALPFDICPHNSFLGSALPSICTHKISHSLYCDPVAELMFCDFVL